MCLFFSILYLIILKNIQTNIRRWNQYDEFKVLNLFFLLIHQVFNFNSIKVLLFDVFLL
jgi:hypothetical protein